MAAQSVYKTKWFANWAARRDLTDDALALAVSEIERGLVEAALGGNLYKKRVPLAGRGKRGSGRVVIVSRRMSNAFFVYGFAKTDRTGITKKELKALKMLAAELLGYTPAGIVKALDAGELIEVRRDG